MITLPKIIDAHDILLNEDEQGINKIASAGIECDALDLTTDKPEVPNNKFACIVKTADLDLRKFPIDSKVNTELSIIAFNHTNSALPDELVKIASTNLLKAAYQWGTEKNLDDLKKYASSDVCGNTVRLSKLNEKNYMKKVAVAPETIEFKVFALRDKYPIDTPELVKRAEVYYKQYSAKLDPLEKYKYCTTLIKQANVLECQLVEPSILKYANLRYERNPNLEMLLKIRDTKSPTHGAYKEIAKVASRVSLEKVAEAIFTLDSEFGYVRHYDKMVPDPIFTVFSSLEKTSENINGKNVTLESVRAIPKEDLSKYLSNDAIDELHGDHGLEVLTSLPEPIIEDILGMI